MCEYCGCQQNDVIAELTAEHDRIRELSHDLAAAAQASDLGAASRLAAAIRAVMAPHTQVEEVALFPAFDADFADQLAELVAEHRDLDVALTEVEAGRPEPGWELRTTVALAHLFDHILKEQDGVFPAALAMFSTAQWEILAGARDQAHAAMASEVASPA